MDLTQSYPNIILYKILTQYVENKINFEYYNNLHLSNTDIQNNIFFTNDKTSHNFNISNFNDECEITNKQCTDDEIDENIFSCKNKNIKAKSLINNDEIDNREIDAWESAINDEKFYINNKIARIFPVLKNFNNFSKIKIDDDSFSYITIREIADTISKIICYHLLEHNLNPQKCSIADYTSGVGGNVLSFGKFFKLVYAIELDELRGEYLKNNIGVYGYKNINVINGCAIEFNSCKLIEYNPNVVFIDPPWGGAGYKNNENLTLKLGSVNLEELVMDIIEKFSVHNNQIVNSNHKEKFNNYNNKFIVLKLPKNYDIVYFYKYVKERNNYDNYNIMMYLYILNKMIIIVCELQYKYY